MQNVQTLKLTRTKEIVFSAVFTAMAVYAPMLVHYLGGVNAGRKFLPMPFFVLLAGLALGWRAGLVAGLASPIISYMLSGMPMLPILPIIIVQLCAFGFFTGILKEKHNVFVSLAGAIILGFLSMGLAVLFFSKMNAVVFVASAVRDGWFGILAQITLIPLLAKILALKPRQD
ncbi:MAG: hypothetical protein QMD77_02915 [Patescibacteria group bacterium]|nr:hypothetical protein [Patescibacteria group bacterium]